MKARDDTGRNGSNGIAASLRDGGAVRTRAVASPAPDPAAAFDRLSRRHRECLRGVRALKGSKEIAEELGIEKSTVDSYLTEAVKLLGARNRRDAALRWAAYEDQAAEPSAEFTTIIPEAGDPDKIGGHSARLSPLAADPPLPVVPDETIVMAADSGGARPFRSSAFPIRLPFRRKGQRGNDLTVGDRLIWIQAIAFGTIVGFGMLMSGLQALTHLIEALTRNLS
ncbi:helix-turn-helix domain-containing protein [Sphingomonas sp. NIC1]|uniref:helix-turn-helix domain-containing protein n=1 Tax=Sphingomonas sp. NIC1 TaxID=1961362 RepID=UPI0007C0CF42|nr:helix-turn-helix transcriptional regulator [Sphingomonas sp. NIC1]ANC87206.1 helix-turn-helix transcriptional regulator [Sphingomonas sp. NIC1]